MSNSQEEMSNPQQEEMKKFLPHADEERIKKIVTIKLAFMKDEISEEEAKNQVKESLGLIKSYEIALAEQYLREFEGEDLGKSDIQQMLDLFTDVIDPARPDLHEEHPIMFYYRENDRLREILLEMEELLKKDFIKNPWLGIYELLAEYRTHLSRKQNQLYSVLEQKGFHRPTDTMWTLDNFIRDEISDAHKLLNACSDAGKEDEAGEAAAEAEKKFLEVQQVIVDDIRDLMFKEERVLYPTSLSMINDEEFAEMRSGDLEIGFAWVKPSAELVEKTTERAKKAKAEKATSDAGAAATASAEPEVPVDLAKELSKLLQKHGYAPQKEEEKPAESTVYDVSMGKLTLEQINLIYRHMPVDLSYVDENEIVKFYSDTKHRIFPRSKNVIGRDVKNCHPRKSVHLVEEIIEKFRSGEQDTADFWINKPGLFIYIHYVAVRDEEDKFRGVLEMMQDCTKIRALEDSRTLLTWDNEKKAEEPGKSDKTGEKAAAGEKDPLAKKSEEPAKEPAKTENGAEAGAGTDPEARKKVESGEITAETRLQDLLAVHPWLKDELPKVNSEFRMLKTPLARVMIPHVNVLMMSEKSGTPLPEMIQQLKDLIASR